MSNIKVITGKFKQPPNGGGSEPPMELVEKVSALEKDMRDVRDRLVVIETKIDNFSTKADLNEAINTQTWRLVTFVCSFGTALVAAVYYIAKHST